MRISIFGLPESTIFEELEDKYFSATQVKDMSDDNNVTDSFPQKHNSSNWDQLTFGQLSKELKVFLISYNSFSHLNAAQFLKHFW